MKQYGYIRVSTKEQNPDRQIAAMREFGLSDEDLVIEAQSGFSSHSRMISSLRISGSPPVNI